MPSWTLTSITAEDSELIFDSATLHVDPTRGNEWWIQIRGLRCPPQPLLVEPSVKVLLVTEKQEKLEGRVVPQAALADTASKREKGLLAVLEGRDQLRDRAE